VPPPGGIKSALQRGKLFSKTAAFMAAFGLMCDMHARHSHNFLFLKTVYAGFRLNLPRVSGPGPERDLRKTDTGKIAFAGWSPRREIEKKSLLSRSQVYP
ncbi:MAG: hypothetical protein DRH37_07685, partial [Deltaproteobacteria bacterium]